jgi:hypothetical protein
MIKEVKGRYRDHPYMLWGRASRRQPDGSNLDGPVEKWTPNVTVLRTIIKFGDK